MDAEAEPDSNWIVEEEMKKNEKDQQKNEDKEEGEITDDDNWQEPVTSSCTAEQDLHKMENKDPDIESTVTSTNEDFSPTKSEAKSPKAYKLGETVEKLRKTISFMFKKKHDEAEKTSKKNDDSSSDELKGTESSNGETQTSKICRNGEHSPQETESGEVSDQEQHDETTDGKEVSVGKGDDEQSEGNAEDAGTKCDSEAGKTESLSKEDKGAVDKDDDDDSLRTPDPSSLSKSVMHLVDSVINENLIKEKSSVVEEKQSKVRVSPKASIKVHETTSVRTTPASTAILSPKELDDQSTILSYNPNLDIFRCDARTCGIKTSKEEVIKAHIEQHAGSQNVWYKCIYCKTITKSIENIRKHLQKFHVTNILRFSKLNSPSVQDVYKSLTGATKREAKEEGKKESESDEPPVLIEDDDEKNNGMKSTPRTIPVRRSSTGSSVKPAPIIRRNSSDSAKTNYTTRLECYYKDQYYRCKMCGFKSLNAETFASHAYYHLHGSDGKKGLANCGSANKPHDVVNCTVVKGMMSLLQRQKEAENRSSSTSPKASPVVGNSGMSTTQIQSRVTGTQAAKLVLPIQPSATSTPAGKTQRLIIIPASQSSNTNVSQVQVPVTTPSPIVIEPKLSSGSREPPIMIESVTPKAKEVKLVGLKQTLKSVQKIKYTSQVFAVPANCSKVVELPDSDLGEMTQPLSKCVYRDGDFVCLLCDYKCPSVRPISFRRHLWKDIHPQNECSHCAPAVALHKFRNCPIMNDLMGLLNKAMQSAAKQIKTTEDEEAKISADEVVDLDGDLLDNIDKTANGTEIRKETEVTESDVDMAEVNKPLSETGGCSLQKKTDICHDDVDAEDVQGPIKPIELDSDFSGEDEYEDDVDEEGLRFGLFERKSPVLSRLMSYARTKNKSLMEESNESPPSPDDDSTEKLYSCVFLRCSQWSTNSAESFTIHNLTQHARTPVLPCSYCSGSFRDEHQLVNHINSSHKLGDNKLSRLYQCAVDQCYFATNYINEFKSHNTFEHSGNFELKCIYCNSKFPHGDYLVQHLQENIMKLIQCPLCPLASQMKSVILTHISQSHPDHPKRIITTSYTTCQKKLQLDDGDNESLEEVDKRDPKRRSSIGSSQQQQDDAETTSKEEENQKQKAKPNILQRRTGAIGGSINCNFICGTCSYSTNVQDDFHDHITSCLKGRKSPKATAIHPSGSKEPEAQQKAIVQPEDAESKISRDHSRKSKPGSRTWEGAEVLFQDEEQVNTSQDDVKSSSSDNEKGQGKPDQTDLAEPKHKSEIPKKINIPPKPGPEKSCTQCAYTTVYEDVLPKHEASHSGYQNTKRNFICFLCKFSADKLKVYKYHLWLHKTCKPDRYYSCYYCKTHSNQQAVLEKHIEETHKTLAFKYEVVKEVVTKLECLYCSKVAYSGTEEEMVKHVLSSHGMPRLHRFIGDVYDFDVGEAPDILSQDQENDPSIGLSFNEKDHQILEESPSRPVRAVRSRQNTIEEILNENPTEGETVIRKTSLTGMEDRFQCPYCNFTADEMYVWKKHMQKYVTFGSQDFPVYRCAKCKWTSTKRQRVLDHAYGKHTLGPDLTEEDIAVAGIVEIQGTGQGTSQLTGSIERYHCDQCEFGSNQRHLLVKHMDEVHGKDKNDSADGLEEIAEAGDEIGFDDDPSDDYAPGGARRSSGERHDSGSGGLKTKFFRCETCPYVTADKRLYYKHKKSHERQSKIQNGFQCGYCHFKAMKAFIVKAHINKYHQAKNLKVLSIADGRPVKVFYDNDVFGEDIEEEEEPDQAFPIQPVKGKAPLEVMKDLAEKPQQAVPSLPPGLNKLVVTPTKGTNIPEDMIFKVPQKCPYCDFSTKVRYNLVRHLKSHQDNQDVGTDKEASQTQGTASASTEGRSQDEETYGQSDTSTEDDDDETGGEPMKKKIKLSQDLSVYGYKIPNKDLYQCKKCVFMDKVSSKVRRHFCARHENFCPFKCGHCSFVSVSTRRIAKHFGKAHPGEAATIIDRKEQVKLLEGSESSETKADQTSKIPQKPAPVKLAQQKADGPVRVPESTDEFDEKLQSYIEPNNKDSSLFKCRLCGHDQDAVPALKRHILSVHLVFYPYKCKYCFFAAVELNKTIKHVERSHPGQPLLVKKRKFTGEWPKLSDGTIPFDNSGPPAPKLTKEPLQVQITSVPTDAAPSPKMPILSRAPVMKPPVSTQEKPKMLVSLLTQAKVPAIPIHPAPDMVIKAEPVDTYWDAQNTSGNWSWHSPQGIVPRGSSREATPLRTGVADETSSQTTTSSGAEETEKSEKKKLLYNCLYCGYQSKWAVKDVKIHLCAVHMRKYPYKCKHCPYTNRMKNNIFKHIKQEHPGMGLEFEDLIKEIDGMICVKEDSGTGMVYIGAYNEDGGIWEVEKANAYRKEVVGGWNVAEFQKLTEIQMNRTQSMGKPKVSANKQRVELVVPRPFSTYSMGKTLPQSNQTRIAPVSILASPPQLKSLAGSSGERQRVQGANADFQDTNKEQVICHRCKICDYRHGHLMKVYLHYLGVHLRKKPYVCGHCGFSQYTRHIVEKHHKIEHSHLAQHIRYLIPELKEEMKPYIVKVISKSRSTSLGGNQNSNQGTTTFIEQSISSQNTVSVFPEPVSDSASSSTRPSPDKSVGTPASSGAGTPTNIKGNNNSSKKVGSRFGKLESAIQRLAQNALNNASSSSATPSPTMMENAEHRDGDSWDGDQITDTSNPTSFITEDITEDLSTPGQNKCDLCPFIGKSFRILKHHRRTHFSYRPYGCKYCALKSFYIANIRSHCELKHPGKPSAYLQFEKPTVLQLDTSDRRLDKSLTSKSSNSQNTSADNEDDSILGLSSKMLPPLSKEDLALAEQGGLLDPQGEEGSAPPSNEPVGPVICPLCPHFLPSSLELRKHLSSSHPGYGPYKCGYCSGIQRFKKGMKSHLSSRHPTMPPKYTLVDPSIPQGPQKNRNEKDKQGKDGAVGDSERSTDTPFMTEGAEEMSIDTSDMIEYVEDVSNGEKDDDDELKRNLADASSLYKCKLCIFLTKQGGAIRHHVMSHLSYCPFKCGHCGRQSVKSYPIKLHIKRQHPGKSMRVLNNRNEEIEKTLSTYYVKHAVKNQSLTDVKSSVEVSSLGTWRGKRKQFENSKQKSPGDSSSDKEKTLNDGLTSPNEDTIGESGFEDQMMLETQKTPELLQYEKTLGNRKVYYQCVLCGFKCDNNTSIRRHLMWETTYKPYCCSLCKRTDILAAAMRKHLRDKHPHSSGRVIFKKNTQKEQRLVSLVNQSRHYTEKYKPPRIITPISPPRPASEDSLEASDENLTPTKIPTVLSDQKPLTPKKLANGLVKCPSCPKIMKLKLFRKHMVFHGGHRVKCDICDKTFYYPSDVHKHHGTAHRNLDVPYQWSKLPTPVKPQNSRKVIHSPPPTNSSSGLLKVKIAFKKDAQPEIVHTPSQDVNGANRLPSGGNRHPNLITTDAIKFVQETDPDNPIPPHSKQASGTPMIDGLMLSAELFKKKSSGKLHCPHCPYVTTNREHLKIHYIRHVPPRWKCKYCETKGQLSYELRKHVKARHPEKPLQMLKLELDYSLARENQGDGPLGPDFRPRMNTAEDDREDEEVDEEYDEDADVDELDSASHSESETTKPVNMDSLHFNCFHCSFTAKSMMEFANHVKTHKQNSPVKSPGSSKAPASPIHTDDDETEQFVTVTPVYGKRASTDNELSDEIKEPQHQCKLCPFSCDSLDDFEVHNRIHLPFRCGYCSYSQYQRGKIKQHHNYKHAPEGLELKIIEQNPKPPKKTEPYSKPGPKSTKKAAENEPPKKVHIVRWSKPGPKSTKKGYVEDSTGVEYQAGHISSDESDEEDEAPKINYNDAMYQPTMKLLDVQLLSDELLSVLLMKYGAARTPWMEAPLDGDMNISGESDSRGYMENPDEEEMELHLGDVSDNREIAFASDLEDDTNGDEYEQEEEEMALDEDEEDADLLDVGDEEIRVEDEGVMNEDE